MENIYQLPELPYAKTALAPYLSKETIEVHYQKHHAGYIKNLNIMVHNTDYHGLSLEELITRTSGAIFNNAAQAWNHAFYWRCMTPRITKPRGELLEAIHELYSSMEIFYTEFAVFATNHFGSGWAWLVIDENGKLAITSTHDADTPIRHHQVPLLACDVWEHAYYLDYRNRRAEYVKNFWHIINWDFVGQQFEHAQHKKAA